MANSTKNLIVVNWQQSVSLQDCRELANGTASDNIAAVHSALAAGVGADCRFASVCARNVLICIYITMDVRVRVCVCARIEYALISVCTINQCLFVTIAIETFITMCEYE